MPTTSPLPSAPSEREFVTVCDSSFSVPLRTNSEFCGAGRSLLKKLRPSVNQQQKVISIDMALLRNRTDEQGPTRFQIFSDLLREAEGGNGLPLPEDMNVTMFNGKREYGNT